MTAMQPRSRQEAEMLGLPAWQIDAMFPPATGGGLLGGFNPETQGAIDEYAAMDGLLAPPAPDRFWQGGKKFGVKDGLAGLLAAAGDALMAQAGMGGGAVQGLLGGRSSALDEFKKKAEQERKEKELRARMTLGGLTPEQQDAEIYNYSLPEREKPPAIGQNLDYFMQNILPDKDRLAAFKQYQDLTNPWRVMGQDGRPYDMGGPQPGSVEDGHQFMGGDPSDPKNWKPVGGGTGNGVGGF